MFHASRRQLGRLLVPLALLTHVARGAGEDAPATFGSVRHGAQTAPIAWERGKSVEITSGSLLLRRSSQIRSNVLPLRTLRLYAISATMRRGPGLRIRFSIAFTDRQGKAQEWGPVWQFPESPRPDWLPVSPRSQRYVQGFILPSDARDARLLLEVEAQPGRRQQAGDGWELTQLEFLELQPVACCERLGASRLLAGDMETPIRRELPVGWEQWGSPTSGGVELVELTREPTRKHVLRIRAGKQVLVGSSAPIPVVRGTAWQISFHVRGKGQVQALAHSLWDASLRIDHTQVRSFQVASPTWTRLEMVWFAEAPGIRFAQVAFGIIAQDDVELDDVEFRPYSSR
jgi:hypothetical protein